MVYTGYLAVGGIPIVDNARTRAYASALGITTVDCDSCESAVPEPRQMIWRDVPARYRTWTDVIAGNATWQQLRDRTIPGPSHWTSPAADAAPWYDPAVPESAHFAGLLGLAFTGTGSTSALTMTERIGDGAVLSRTRQAHRELHLSGAILAASEAGASYGAAWIAQALQQACGTGSDACAGGSAVVYAACPTSVTESASYRRTLRGVRVLQSISDPASPTTIFTSSCESGSGRMWLVDLILACEPYFYWPARQFTPPAGIPFINPTIWPTENAWWRDDGTTSWLMPDCGKAIPPGPDPECAPVGVCMSDPLCPPPPAPPLPPTIADACVSVLPLDPMVARVKVSAPGEPTQIPTVPVVLISAGTEDMRRTLIRFYAVDASEHCSINQLDPCSIIGEYGIPYLPAGTSVVLDGTSRTATVTCPDGSKASAVLYDTKGPASRWPVLQCSQAYCIVASTEKAGADGASFSLALLPRAESA